MSYMNPLYIPQTQFNSTWTPLAERYSLVLYREDQWERELHGGTPVLFIPGNAGSSGQVRSIASSATRQYYSRPNVPTYETWSRNMKALDFFAADFNEDLSAFHGPTLKAQIEYCARAISYILSLYPPNTSIIIMGHSMGGIVATSLLPSKDISSIITMSTPHTLPPARFDQRVDEIYALHKLIPNPIPGHTFPVPQQGTDESEGVVVFEADVIPERNSDAQWIAVNVERAAGEGWLVGGFVSADQVFDDVSMTKMLLGGTRVTLSDPAALWTSSCAGQLASYRSSSSKPGELERATASRACLLLAIPSAILVNDSYPNLWMEGEWLYAPIAPLLLMVASGLAYILCETARRSYKRAKKHSRINSCASDCFPSPDPVSQVDTAIPLLSRDESPSGGRRGSEQPSHKHLITAPVLVVWVRTLVTAGLSTPFDGDHFFLNVAPFMILVDYASWTSNPLLQKHRVEKYFSASWTLWLVAGVAFFVGPRKTYHVFDAAQLAIEMLTVLRIGPQYWVFCLHEIIKFHVGFLISLPDLRLTPVPFAFLAGFWIVVYWA
ncbi:PGAP1-domain-containing protein [Lentinula edodes]|uniref:GPI inositol-deacylase n=1 Tax=Lentinula edodes TaxID=5353 RepID=A0A1Q3E0S4_LENED|nr:PGAP1-domain-containing protein [Lentinula edodes]